MTKTKPNLKVLIPGGLLLLPPAFIVFQGVQNLASVPPAVAVFTLAGLVSISVILIFQGLRNLAEGDVNDARVQFVIGGLILLSEFIGQWWFAIAEHHALVTALIFSMLSLGGAAIVESEIMRVWRASARQTRMMSLARPQVPADVRRAFPTVAAYAQKLAIRYPNATQASILDEAFAEFDRVNSATPPPAQVRVSVTTLRGGFIPGKNVRTEAADGAQSELEGGPARTLSDLVREGLMLHGADKAEVRAHVMRLRADADPESVRKTIAREIKPYLVDDAEQTG